MGSGVGAGGWFSVVGGAPVSVENVEGTADGLGVAEASVVAGVLGLYIWIMDSISSPASTSS